MLHLLPVLLLGAVPVSAAQTPPDTTLYRQILQAHVNNRGKVNYAAIRQNIEPLDRFVRQMENVSPDSHADLFPSDAARLAYWLNAYNALVLHAFALEYPEERGRLSGWFGKWKFFYLKKFTLGGRQMSLHSLENDVIRKRFEEPRIHFALVCASSSCPWLQREPFTAENLEKLLEAETRRYLNDSANVRVDERRKKVRLSKLFDWYGKDFGQSDAEIFRFVARFNDALRPVAAGPAGWDIEYFDYDWSPNDLR